MRYYIIAGEASGDLHGSNLIRSLKQKDSTATIRCWGGDKMKSAGGDVVKHIKDLAFMGFAEVLRNLPAILRNIRFCKEDILKFNPDAVILIDYPGFNLRIASWAKNRGFKTIYYISPQIWAWNENRVKKIKKSVDRMLVIFPFEKSFYKKWDFDVDYVGHPLVAITREFKEKHPVKRNEKVIALLPGSRKQEITRKLPVMLSVMKNFPSYQFFIARAPSVDLLLYKQFMEGYDNVSLREEAYPLLLEAGSAVVTSGTATLEAALLGTPEIICYKTSRLSYEFGKRLIKLKFICIVNLIMNKEVVKELIQENLTTETLTRELSELIHNEEKRKKMLFDYDELRNRLMTTGNASDNAAEKIITFLNA